MVSSRMRLRPFQFARNEHRIEHVQYPVAPKYILDPRLHHVAEQHERVLGRQLGENLLVLFREMRVEPGTVDVLDALRFARSR